jgi:hypothetical protein
VDLSGRAHAHEFKLQIKDLYGKKATTRKMKRVLYCRAIHLQQPGYNLNSLRGENSPLKQRASFDGSASPIRGEEEVPGIKRNDEIHVSVGLDRFGF